MVIRSVFLQNIEDDVREKIDYKNLIIIKLLNKDSIK